jgi:hypothetical protein
MAVVVRRMLSMQGNRARLHWCSPPNINTTTLVPYVMAEEQAAHHLLNVLEERGLDDGLDLDKVLATFENDDTKRQAAEWVTEYLHEDTLLTREELEL